jgi:subtilisin family serine protease
LGRRFLLVFVLSLVTAVTAAGAFARTLDEPLQGQEWWLGHIGITGLTPPGPGVPITIIDSGTDPTHPEFAGRPNTTFGATQSVTGPGEFHGTMVASIAAAPANGVGMVGVYPNAALELYDISPTGQSTSLDIVAGLDAAAAHCPAVINLSFGSSSQDPAVHDEVLKAVHNGCLVVAAAGNDGDLGNLPSYPAAWPHVLTVAASDAANAVAPFSTTSPANDLTAPGVGILGAVPFSHNPVGYESHDGTSFSTPIVSAAAAWVWTLRPMLTAGQRADVLRAGAHDIGPPGFDNASGFGLLSIPGALAAPTPPNDPDEPNDDVDQVKPGALFADGRPPLTTPSQPSTRIAASLDSAEDPRDLDRIWVPAHRTILVRVNAGGRAAARIWGPQTISIDETIGPRRRDLKGPTIRAGKKGIPAYVEVLLTGRSLRTRYVLSVTAAKR